MKTIWKLTAWQWRMVRFPFAVLCGVYAIQQLTLLLLSAADPRKLGYQMAELFQGCGQMPLFFATLYLVAVVAASATRTQAKSQQTYTLYTMPFSRWNLWAAQFLLGLLLLLLFTAWQVFLYAAAYFPVTMILSRVAESMVVNALPWNSLVEELNANLLMQLLLPVKAGSGLTLLGVPIITALHSACMACCHGLRRAVVALLALFGTGTAYAAFYIRYHQVIYGNNAPSYWLLFAVVLVLALGLAVVNVFQAVWALKRAETA